MTNQPPPNFISGLDLAEAFYFEAVKPILDAHFPDLRHTAARIGAGSEVLGFDDPMSTDHDWGPRFQLFIPSETLKQQGGTIKQTLSNHLPRTFKGYPTGWSAPDPADNNTQIPQDDLNAPLNHRIELYTIEGLYHYYLGLRYSEPLEPVDWLTLPSQKLRSITAGRIFADGLEIQQQLDLFHWYPHDVWLYLLAAGWQRIGQEEHLTGRAGFAGDELGSKLIAARLVRDVMRQAFLLERVYAPYAKWFGTAFEQLEAAATLRPLLEQVLAVDGWQARDKPLAQVYAVLGEMQNRLQICEAVSVETRSFFERPFTVIFAGRFKDALVTQIQDPLLKKLAHTAPFGGIDQLSDNTDLLENVGIRPLLRQLLAAQHLS